MGDRAHIALKQDKGTIYLYSHWDGRDLYQKLARALERGRGRWDDEEYLGRIIFSEMIRDDINGETGYGIGLQSHGDVYYAIPVVDCNSQTVTWENTSEPAYKSLGFAEYIERYKDAE
jgi:hypothetical protein